MVNPSFDDRLERLLSAAAKVFATKGYHPTTMRDLSRVTGMSLAGMYYYVRGKDELLFAIQERTFRRLVGGAEEAVRDGRDALDRLHRFIRHHVTFFAQHMAEMKVLAHEAKSLGAERRAAVTELKRRHTGILIAILETLDDGASERVPPRIAAFALFGMMNWMYTWYDPGGPVSPPALADHVAEIFLRGVVQVPAIRDC